MTAFAPDDAFLAKYRQGDALIRSGDLDGAERLFSELCAARPDHRPTCLTLCKILYSRGKQIEALTYAVAANRLGEDDESRLMFGLCLPTVAVSKSDEALATVTRRALIGRWNRPGDLARPAIRIVKLSHWFAPALALADTAPVAEALAYPVIQALQADPLAAAILESAVVTDEELERLLRWVRLCLLLAAGREPALEQTVRFAEALAHQCFHNEYAWLCSAEEHAHADNLWARVETACRGGSAPDALCLAVAACYRPLYQRDGSLALTVPDLPPGSVRLLNDQLVNPVAERVLGRSIALLTPIADGVSQAVREQYEESPYPRWRPVLRHRRRISALPAVDATIRSVLVAGCGTGQHAIDTAVNYPHAEILAIDLSGASLSYALRETMSLGLTNIRYAQADIMLLGSIDERFDLIESAGVLHHLADPVAGWRILAGLLKPGGRMLIALYSRYSRQSLEPARQFISEQGYSDAPADVRQFRTALRQLPTDHPARQVVDFRDFYTLSECRDLLFHRQEHMFTIAEIDAAIREIGLEFAGFRVTPLIARLYRDRFPADKAMLDLDNWAKFETEVPAFRGMYQFDVRRP